MDGIDNEKFGTFVSYLRKEKGFTQKELAEKLLISDKAISKWERGLSMPDIALLLPLSESLGVTITELLRGERMESPEPMPMQEVEALVAGTIRLSAQEEAATAERRKKRIIAYVLCLGIVVLEITILFLLGFTGENISSNLMLVEPMLLVFGAYFCIFAQETLPSYYDKNKISGYYDGVFRMNMVGLNFNNRNWPHILRVLRIWTLCVPVVFPIIFAVCYTLSPNVWDAGKVFFTLAPCLGMFIPVYIVGDKYE